MTSSSLVKCFIKQNSWLIYQTTSLLCSLYFVFHLFVYKMQTLNPSSLEHKISVINIYYYFLLNFKKNIFAFKFVFFKSLFSPHLIHSCNCILLQFCTSSKLFLFYFTHWSCHGSSFNIRTLFIYLFTSF